MKSQIIKLKKYGLSYDNHYYTDPIYDSKKSSKD